MPANTQQNTGTAVGYQNPATTSLTLDSEVVGPDPSAAGAQLTREFVVPQESISGSDPYSRIGDFLEQMLDELKKIRVLLEQDVPPGLADDVLDEAQNQSGTAEEGWGSEGIEEI
jgi:hypothetical protein